MKFSLQARLLITAFIILLTFIGLTGAALDKAFRKSAETALQERLKGYMFALLAATEVSEDGKLSFSRQLPDARFQQPGSGLYAQVSRTDNQAVLTSPSLLSVAMKSPPAPLTGQGRFLRMQTDDHIPLYAYLFSVNWDYGDRHYPVSYFLAEDLHGYQRQITEYRNSLWGWLGAASLLLLLAQGAILRWGLKPLRQVEQEVAQIEAGNSDELHGQYPRELQGLTSNLNILLKSTRQQMNRYRDALGNVSHSLKTPLSVLRGAVADRTDEKHSTQLANEQLERMQQIIDYHLQRAATAGRQLFAKPVAIRPVVEKITAMLKKIHAERAIQLHCDIGEHVQFLGDEGDLYEILGNLLDNAFKWSRREVCIVAENTSNMSLRLIISDDGPGIPEQVRNNILQRGKRADPMVEGHGIGLAMVHETVLLYGGKLEIRESQKGGALIQVDIPGVTTAVGEGRDASDE